MTDTANQGQTSQAMVKGPKARFDKLSDLMISKKDAIAALLPRHLTADRMLRVVLSAASRKPALLDCSPQSFVLAVATAAFLGLEPDTPLQRGYLIPRANKHTKVVEATFMPGYKGLIWLALQSGHVESIDTAIVYEREITEGRFEVRRGTDPGILHKPLIIGDRGEPVATYAVATLKSGGRMFEVMNRDDIARIRSRSGSPDDGPWVTDPLQMWRKSGIRRLSNYLPLSEERFAVALRHDRRIEEEGDPGDLAELLDTLPGATAKALTEGLGEEAPALSQGAPATGERQDPGKALADQLKLGGDKKA